MLSAGCTAMLVGGGSGGSSSSAPVDDAAIVEQVRAALKADRDLRMASISVRSSNGSVTLSGSAPSAAAKDRATWVARGIDGVRTVNNRLRVARTPR